MAHVAPPTQYTKRIRTLGYSMNAPRCPHLLPTPATPSFAHAIVAPIVNLDDALVKCCASFVRSIPATLGGSQAEHGALIRCSEEQRKAGLREPRSCGNMSDRRDMTTHRSPTVTEFRSDAIDDLFTQAFLPAWQHIYSYSFLVLYLLCIGYATNCEIRLSDGPGGLWRGA